MPITKQSTTLEYTCDLIRRASVTPKDEGCQDFMIEKLEALGFEITRLPFGEGDERVENFWAVYDGSKSNGSETTAPTLIFAGHTDVVPTGDLSAWDSDPFEPTMVNGELVGRGAADMKGSLAAMLACCERFIQQHPAFNGRIGFLITSDEEGPATYGTVKVVEWLQEQQQRIDYCIVGEPSSTATLGDVIKNGRRGSLNGYLRINGKQGHIAYPHLADNPIHRSSEALVKLVAEQWDQGNDYFPPTSFQISNMNSGTGATNVIPGHTEMVFNFRYSTETTADQLRERVAKILDGCDINYQLDWVHSGEPFLTPAGELTDACASVIKKVTGTQATLSTTGGTSDGRFIAKLGCQLVELGPINKTIHQINERVDANSLDQLTEVYQGVLESLFI
ncbi:MAG: succinyl-diaminopimelate desuccinylase [Pseudomonadota bacterium]|nr:succinyl-diaminopimelate desuccinylase [Pseudomonadota bacterium]